MWKRRSIAKSRWGKVTSYIQENEGRLTGLVIWGNEGIAPLILNHNGGRLSALPQGKSPWYKMCSRLSGPHSHSGHFEQETNLCSHQVSTYNSSGVQPVAQSLYWLSYCSSYIQWEEYFILTLITDSGSPFWITKCTRNFARFVTWKEAMFLSSLNLSQRAHWIAICKST
jgi:hypothetical protein